MIVQSTNPKRKLSDPAATRAKILEASLNLFCEYGYHAVSFAQIAEATDIPKSLIAYHFGNKDELWGEVIQRSMAPVLDAMDRFLAGELSAAELVQARFTIFAKNPARVRLLGWSSLTNVPMPAPLQQRKESIRQRLHSAKPESVRQCLLAISMMDGWFLNRNTYSLLLGQEGIELMTIERLKCEIDKLIEAKP